MNYEQATNDELLAEVTACIIEQREFNGFSQVLRRVQAKQLSNEAFTEAQRKGFEVIFPQMMEAYRAGYYFGCQGLDFLSCLLLTRAEVEKDRSRWSEMLGAAEALGLAQAPEFQEPKAFTESRVLMPYEERRQFVTAKNELKAAASLSEATRKGFERKRDAFLTAAMKYNWKQVTR